MERVTQKEDKFLTKVKVEMRTKAEQYTEIERFARENFLDSNLDYAYYFIHLLNAFFLGYEVEQLYYFKAPDWANFLLLDGSDYTPNDNYLNFCGDGDGYFTICDKGETSTYKTKFTLDEINEIIDNYSHLFNFENWTKELCNK